MKLILPFIITLLMCCHLYGQSTFQLGVTIMPEFSLPFIDKSESPHSFQSRITLTGSFGIKACYPFSDHSGIYVSSLYSLKRFSVDASNIFLESNNFASETRIYESLNVGSLFIPFVMYYNLSPDWQLTSGLGFNFLIYESRFRNIYNGGDEEMKLFNNHRDFTPGLLSVQIGLLKKVRNKMFQFDLSPQLWLHTHSGEIPLLAKTDFQLSLGVEMIAWID